MDILYTVEDDTLTLEIEAANIDRKAAFKRLRKLGAPLELEFGIVTRATIPKAAVHELRAALTMVGGSLRPAEGEPDLNEVEGRAPRYEDLRPEDPDEVVAVARQDEDPGPVLREAIRRFRSFKLNNPPFKERADRDIRFLERALERFAPEPKEDRPEPAGDPVRLQVSRAVQGIPAADVWRAREFLLELHNVAGTAGGEAPMADVPDPVPGFQGRLRRYQREGVSFLLGRNLNGVLADDMGLGKTVMTIAAVLCADERALVVAPANVLHNWAAEVERFTGEPAAIWHGRDCDDNDAARFRITTYGSLRTLDWRHTDAASRPVLVLDEAHMVRNPDTQRARLVKDLPQARRLLLTGTPIVNGMEDYNQLLLLVGEDRWADATAFRDTWMKDRQILQRHARLRAAAADLLQRATGHVVMRRRKEDVLSELPPRTITVDRYDMDETQRATYEGLEERAREVWAHAESQVQVFAHLHKLRQHLVRCRVPYLEQRVRELLDAGEAVIVYAHYLEPLRELRERLGDVSATIDGSTPPRARERIARELGDPDGPQVLLAQMEAGGVGLNLVGARYVIFAHLGWTAAVHRQAIDRVHRIGQSRPVQIEFVVTPETIDERMADIILRKEADANLALSDEGDVLNRAELAGVLLEAEDGPRMG